MTPSRFAPLLAALIVFAAACGDDNAETAPPTTTEAAASSGDDAPTDSTEDDPDATTDSTADSTDDTSTDDEPASEPERDLRTTLAERGVAELSLDPTVESGSHPTLSWPAVDGATSYWLVLLDSAGEPYWAWTGSATSVRVGGGDRDATNQTAALHEPMTWTVSAFDAAGALLAISEPANAAP